MILVAVVVLVVVVVVVLIYCTVVHVYRNFIMSSSSSSSKYITPAYGAGVYINVYSWFQPTVLVCKSIGIDGFSLQCWYIYQVY